MIHLILSMLLISAPCALITFKKELIDISIDERISTILLSQILLVLILYMILITGIILVGISLIQWCHD